MLIATCENSSKRSTFATPLRRGLVPRLGVSFPLMLHTLLRWIMPTLALFALGPLALLLMSSVRAVDGSREVSILLCAAPAKGLAALGVVMLIACAAGIGGALISGQRRGLLSAGIVLAWAAYATGHIDTMLANSITTKSGTSSVLLMLALEGLIVGVLSALVAWIILRVPMLAFAERAARAGEFARAHPAHASGTLSIREPHALFSARAPVAIAAAILGAGVVVWVLAFDSSKGQTLAAAIFAGLAAAAAGRTLAATLSPMLFVAAIGLLAAASPVAAMVLHSGGNAGVSGGGTGSAALSTAALAGTLFRLARPLPLDWLAGALVGIPLGLAWANSLVQKHEPQK